MRTLLAALLLLMITFASCTQRTCPTYTKDDVKENQSKEERV